MGIPFVIRAIFVGFTLAAAVAPIWILTMQRTLTRGWVVGLASGLGVAFADGLFGLAGGLALTDITAASSDFDPVLSVVGGVVLLYLGIRIFSSTTSAEIPAGKRADQVEAQAYLALFVQSSC